MRARLVRSALAAALFAAPAWPACPPEPELVAMVHGLDVSAASRLARFDSPLPDDLYGAAARRQGKAVAARKGDRAFGVMIADRPIELLWKALNDEDHHALDDGDYIPLRTSKVIDGTPRGESRLLLQSFQKVGVGRWWVSRVWMNSDLFAATNGRLWELVWEDRMAEVDPTQPPVREIAEHSTPIRSSRGSWLLVPLADSCTLIEHFTWTDPGGFVGATQWLLAKKAVRDTVEGVVSLADDHVRETPHPGPPFVKPDGTPID